MMEQAYNIIKTKDSRTQRQSNLLMFKEARFKISPQEFEEHTLREIFDLYSHHYAVFNILAELRPEFPAWNAIIKDCLEGKISIYTRFLEFTNFWIPLLMFLLCILEYYQINLSQLSVIGTAKVKIGERTLAENEVPFITETEDRVIVSPLIIPANHYEDVSTNVVRLTLVLGLLLLLRKMLLVNLLLPLQSVLLRVVPLVSSAQADTNVHVTKPASDGRTSSILELEAGALSATSSQGSSVDDFYESQTIDSATALNVYVPNLSIINNALIDNPVTCQNLLDHVTSPGYWAALRNQHDTGFLNSFKINSAQHIYMVSELRLGYEHEIMTREKYEKKFTDSVAMVQ
ncbi:hypothetical protein Tco_1414279 [Tanacetum coccineum]